MKNSLDPKGEEKEWARQWSDFSWLFSTPPLTRIHTLTDNKKTLLPLPAHPQGSSESYKLQQAGYRVSFLSLSSNYYFPESHLKTEIIHMGNVNAEMFMKMLFPQLYSRCLIHETLVWSKF